MLKGGNSVQAKSKYNSTEIIFIQFESNISHKYFHDLEKTIIIMKIKSAFTRINPTYFMQNKRNFEST